jgi:hypothetical protein
MKSLGEAIQKYLQQNGLRELIKEHQAINVYNDDIILEYPMLESSRATDIQQGILKIMAPNSAVSFEIFVRKNDLIQAINRRLSQKIVKDLVIRIGGKHQ